MLVVLVPTSHHTSHPIPSRHILSIDHTNTPMTPPVLPCPIVIPSIRCLTTRRDWRCFESTPRRDCCSRTSTSSRHDRPSITFRTHPQTPTLTHLTSSLISHPLVLAHSYGTRFPVVVAPQAISDFKSNAEDHIVRSSVTANKDMRNDAEAIYRQFMKVD